MYGLDWIEVEVMNLTSCVTLALVIQVFPLGGTYLYHVFDSTRDISSHRNEFVALSFVLSCYISKVILNYQI